MDVPVVVETFRAQTIWHARINAKRQRLALLMLMLVLVPVLMILLLRLLPRLQLPPKSRWRLKASARSNIHVPGIHGLRP